MGRPEKGFDFLGYHFSLEGLLWQKRLLRTFFHMQAVFLSKSGGRRKVPSVLGLYVRRCSVIVAYSTNAHTYYTGCD
jgi:hypothetical protein